MKKLKHAPRMARHYIPHFSGVLLTALQTPLLLYFVFLGNLVTGVAALSFFHFEKLANPNVNHFIDAYWWALCTVSTVGYGDIVPVTTMGRLTGCGLIVIGVTFFMSYLAVLTVAVTKTVEMANLNDNTKGIQG